MVFLPDAANRGKRSLDLRPRRPKAERRVEIPERQAILYQNVASADKDEVIFFKNLIQGENIMKKQLFVRWLSFLLCFVLIAATALTITGCSEKKDAYETVVLTGGELGEGQKTFDFTVVDASGKETAFVIKTDKETVGDALLEQKLIAGDPGDYGLYVKKVNGIVADYDVDKSYWAFYENGEYAMTGVDQTKITDGSAYAFKIEK